MGGAATARRLLPVVLVLLAVGVLVLAALAAYAEPPRPPAPTGVEAEGGDAALTVSFEPSAGPGAETYDVSLNGSAWLPLEVTDGSGGTVSGTVDGLLAGTEYAARVRAADAGGASAPSEAATATTAGTAPQVDVDLVAGVGEVVARLLPTAAVDPAPAGWHVTAEPVSGEGAPRSATCRAASARCVVTGLADDTTYLVRVTPFTSRLPGTLSGLTVDGSPVVEEEVVPSSRPQPPTDLRVGSRDGALALRWSQPQGAVPVERFEVELDGAWTEVDASAADDVRTARLGGLTNGESYDVAVRAVGGEGPGEATETVTATPAGSPSAPRDVQVRLRGTTAVVRWEAPRSSGGADVRRYTVSTRGGRGCQTRELRCTVRGLAPGEQFTFAVRADNTTDGLRGTGPGPLARSRPVAVP